MLKILMIAMLITLGAAGCAKLAIEGGEKPIHIVMDVNVRVARELDEFFDFEDKHPGVATRPASNAVSATTRTH